MKRSAVVLAPALAILFLSACGGSVSVGGDTISSGDIESNASEVLTAQVGEKPKSIDCPDDLDPKTGESETCTLTANDGTTYDMTATIKSVTDGTANFDFKVGNAPTN